MKFFRTAVISLAALSLWSAAAHAAITQPASTFSAGGGFGTSASYSNFGVIGQGQPVGVTTSASFANDAGFIPVLGGWKLLYPIIAVNPSTITFSVLKDGSASQGAALTNDGGSTLNWSAVSNQPWLTVTPASGSGGSALTITATSANFVPGFYQGTINLTGTGARGASLLVTMNVSNLYGLTVTISSDSDNVYGTVTSGDGIACNNQSSTGCYNTYAPSTVVTLMQTPQNSAFGGWPAECTPSGNNCQVTMSSSKTVAVAYTPDPATVKITSNTNRYYILGAAIDAALTGATVSSRNLPFAENLIFDNGTQLKIRGGYTDTGFTTRTPTSFTTIDGSLKVRGGTLRVERLKVK